MVARAAIALLVLAACAWAASAGRAGPLLRGGEQTRDLKQVRRGGPPHSSSLLGVCLRYLSDVGPPGVPGAAAPPCSSRQRPPRGQHNARALPSGHNSRAPHTPLPGARGEPASPCGQERTRREHWGR